MAEHMDPVLFAFKKKINAFANTEMVPVFFAAAFAAQGRYFFKGSTEKRRDGEIPAVVKEEEAEPQNYSFLDLLTPAGKREER